MRNPEQSTSPEEIQQAGAQREWRNDSELSRAFSQLIDVDRREAAQELEGRGWKAFTDESYPRRREIWPSERDNWENGATYFLQLGGERLPEDKVELGKRIRSITGIPIVEEEPADYALAGVRLNRAKESQRPDREHIYLDVPGAGGFLKIGKVESSEVYLPQLQQALEIELQRIEQDVQAGRITADQTKEHQYLVTTAARAHARGSGLAALEAGKVSLAMQCLEFAHDLGEGDAYQIANRVSTRIGELEDSANPADREEFQRVKAHITERAAVLR